MKKYISIWFSTIFPCLLFAQNGYFIPNPLILPLHTQSKQLNLSIGVGRGFDANASFSLTNHFAVFATGLTNVGTFHRQQIMGSGYNVMVENNSYSGGIIYFTKLKKNVVFETAFGFGKFRTFNNRNFDTYFPTITASNYWNAFNQLSLTKTNGNFDFGISNRFSYNKYEKHEILHFYAFSRQVYNDLYSFNIEPVFNLNYNVQKIKFGLQLGLSVPIITDYKNVINYELSSDFVQLYSSNSDELTFLNYIARLSLQYSFDLGHKKK
ncbi:MAG: hypothetical protein EAZ15_01230 [Sphingobacteriales bacterium]|nr:MAG: hypothetical protein EAZ15_01230 [Sphingobacteriales bacterium]